ncbi:MAG: glycerophosphodiester phosphodiesterase, partial [Anaerolineae bacterium]|nr:glycerophosphodiester phosphodiesterase [Anaerolineae bacterium]
HAPQNTLAAFLLAAEMGADGVELDVHLSADGQVVVIHDDTVDATTDGSGRVSALTLAELKALDAGGWFDPRFAGERIPTLQEVFDAVGHRLLINVEIKVEAGYHPLEQEAETVRLIEDNNLVERVIISSFSIASLRRVRRLNPHIALGLLYAQVETRLFPTLARLLGARYEALHPQFGLVDARYVASARRRGLHVNAWTANEVDPMRRLIDVGANGIITNYPDRLRDLLAGHST